MWTQRAREIAQDRERAAYHKALSERVRQWSAAKLQGEVDRPRPPECELTADDRIWIEVVEAEAERRAAQAP